MMRTVAASPELVPFLLSRMGSARAARLQFLLAGEAEAQIARGIAESTLTWCCLDDEGVVAMGGVQPTSCEHTGYVWQYVAAVERNKRAYLVMSRAMIARGLTRYARLLTLIEPENTAALRHVRRMGFTVSEPRDFDGHMGCFCERLR